MQLPSSHSGHRLSLSTTSDSYRFKNSEKTSSNQPAYRLVGETGGRSCSFQITSSVTAVGSHRSNGLALPVAGISKRHAVLTLTDDGVIVEDRGSKNGTWINDRRVVRARLAIGDRLRIGAMTLRLEISHPEDACLALSFESDTGDIHSQAGIEAGSRETELLPPSAPENNGFGPHAGIASVLRFPEGHVTGRSPGIRGLYRDISTVCESPYPALILGETGSGKEMIARCLHESSPRRHHPFVTVNCAAIPADLLEAEMFGVVRGAATGVEPRPGCFSRADGGTLFLDEVGELHPDLQAKLLRALEYGEIHPVGGKMIRVDVRVVSATNVDLERKIQGTSFRADLYYRLAASVLRIPPLRHRSEDLSLLISHFVERFASELDLHVRGVTQRAFDLLADYPWPGNIRELQHELRQAVQKTMPHQALDSSLLSPKLTARPITDPEPETAVVEQGGPELEPTDTDLPEPDHLNLKHHVADVERRIIASALEKAQGNRTVAAQLLHISRNTLATKIALYGLS